MKIKEGGYYRETRLSRAYHGATWATAQAQSTPVARIRRWVRRAWQRVFRLIVIAMSLLLLALAVSIVPIVASLITVTGGGR